MMQWEKLLSSARLGSARDPETGRAQRSAFQRDFDRIVFSSAFRRLQDKTQVFPLAESDYVRTRLTHSLEASCVGRSLGMLIGAHIVEKHRLREVHPSDIGAIVAAACLAHDIGNPPFGHSGEDAIQRWFLSSPRAQALRQELSPAQCADFDRFEGNAQGFRILTRLQMPDNPGGLQLTCATLGAFAKYPVDSLVPKAERKQRASTKKFSFFDSEAPLFAEVAERTGLLSSQNGDSRQWRRHPLAFVVEAADDICYRLVDFEDGVQAKLLGYEEVRDAFLEVIGEKEKYRARIGQIRQEKERLEFLRAVAIGKALEQVAGAFIQHEEALLCGEFEQPLIACTQVAEPLEAIVLRSRDTVYASSRGVEIEIAGYEVIGGLLELFVDAVEDHAATHGNPAARSRKLLQLVPEQFIGPDRVAAPDTYTRVQRVTDFVSGMTDSYAVNLHKKLRGISLPGR
jgi:dGTPase